MTDQDYYADICEDKEPFSQVDVYFMNMKIESIARELSLLRKKIIELEGEKNEQEPIQ